MAGKDYRGKAHRQVKPVPGERATRSAGGDFRAGIVKRTTGVSRFFPVPGITVINGPEKEHAGKAEREAGGQDISRRRRYIKAR
jgi:hypothetical protein